MLVMFLPSVVIVLAVHLLQFCLLPTLLSLLLMLPLPMPLLMPLLMLTLLRLR